MKSFCAIHGVDESLNWGDVCKIDETKLPDMDLYTFGSPCQSFSVAGKQEGSKWECRICKEKNHSLTQWNPLDIHWSKRDVCPVCGSKNIDKTSSSLVVEALRIIRHKKPKYLLMENVKNLVGKQFKSSFDKIIAELEEYGYNTYWNVLDAQHYGIPQHRERVFVISIRKDIDIRSFKFPNQIKLTRFVQDIAEKPAPQYSYLSEKQKDFVLDIKENQNNTKWQGRTNNGLLNPTIAKTLQTKGKARQRAHMNTFFVEGLPVNVTVQEYKEKYSVSHPKIRYATSLERFRLMGFDDNDYYKLLEIGMSENIMNILTGNSIVVDVLYYIFKNLFQTQQ